jgi:alpha-beta hydrolase superfamily lysophospholipase
MATPPTTLRWDEAEGATARGTVIVLAGRGESSAAYARLGQRLAADAYRVRAVGDLTDLDVDGRLLVRSLVAESEAHPVVLVGSDTGALLALTVSTAPDLRVEAVIAAGTPIGASQLAEDADPFDARSVCPVHRRVLTNDEIVDPTAYTRAIPSSLRLPDPASVRPPVLAIHGERDAISPMGLAREYYKGFGDRAALTLVSGGRHDILNDVSHRSVAATIVLLLEQLRNGGTPTTRLELFSEDQEPDSTSIIAPAFTLEPGRSTARANAAVS